MIHLTVSPRNQIFEINLTIWADVYIVNDKILLREVKEGLNQWRNIPCSRIKDWKLLRCQLSQNWSLESMKSQSCMFFFPILPYFYHWFAFSVTCENQVYWRVFLSLWSWGWGKNRIKSNSDLFPRSLHVQDTGEEEKIVRLRENYLRNCRTTKREHFKKKSKDNYHLLQSNQEGCRSK